MPLLPEFAIDVGPQLDVVGVDVFVLDDPRTERTKGVIALWL